MYGKVDITWNSIILLDEFQYTFLKIKNGLFKAWNMKKLSGFYALHVFYYGSTL
jgi:hypothetical protein